MTVKELKEVLASENVPDDAEICYDDYWFIKVMKIKDVEYDEYNNRLIIVQQ